MKFTREQIRREVEAIENASLHSSESEVYDAWADMASDWLVENPGDYLWEGFKGFAERSTDEIILDFHLNDKLEDPLTKEEVDTIISQ